MRKYGEKRKAFHSGEPIMCIKHGVHTNWYYNKSCNQLSCRYCISQQSRNYLSKYPFRKFLTWAKQRKRDYNIDEEYITDLYLQQNGYCALSKLALDEENMSLDRIDSSLGYVRGNVQWTHKLVNRMKSDLKEAAFIHFCEKVALAKRGESRKDYK